jgi:hypothetical protein
MAQGPHRPARTPSNPELETLTFHPRPDADGLVARLGTGALVPPHPSDADRVTPGEAWACTLAEGPGGDTVARLVARVEPAPRGTPESDADPDPSRPSEPGAGGEAPSHPSSRSSSAAHAGPGPGDLRPDEREQLERRREELRQREEMLEAQLEEIRERLLDLDEMLGG